MIRIISDDNYEAMLSLVKHVCKEIKSGVKYDTEDIKGYISTLKNECIDINNKLHKDVLAFENKRYGTQKKLILDSIEQMEAYIGDKTKSDEEMPDFNSMSKEELIEFIKKSRQEKPQPENSEKDEVFKDPVND